jgi:hypothetical protein
MGIKKSMYITFYLLSQILIFYNLFISQFFNVNSYSQLPNSKIEQGTISNIEGIRWSNYTDKKDNFTTIYPNTWKIIEGKNNDSNQNGSITIFRSPKENLNDTFQDNIVISIIKTDKNTPDNNSIEIQTIIKKLETKNKDFKLENFSVADIGNKQTGKSIKYGFENLGINFKTEQIFSTTNDKVYILSLLAEQKTFEKYSQIFNHMLKNTTLKNN